jgi:hypothetical protein
MARLLWGAVVMNVMAALVFGGALLLRSMAAAGNPPGFDDAARTGLELAVGFTLALAAALLSPPVIALRLQRAPPASQRSVGAVMGLVLGALEWVVLCLLVMVFAARERRTEAVLVLVLLVVPNLIALMAAWIWRPWARQPGKPLRWTPP